MPGRTVLTSFRRGFLDHSLEKMRRMIDGTAARDKMAFTKHTIPVFIPLPAITGGPVGNTSNVPEKIVCFVCWGCCASFHLLISFSRSFV